MNRPLVVIPAFNEAASVASVVKSVVSQGMRVVVIDDGSTDSTKSEAQSAGATVVRLPMNLGVGAALRCGFRYAVENGFTTVIQCDADGQHLPEYFQLLIKAADNSNAHLVIGSRFLSDESFPAPRLMRRFAMQFLAKATSRAVGRQLTDVTSGFRLIRGDLLRSFAHEFPTYYLGDTFEATYVAGRAGYRVVEVPVKMRQRAHGQSSASNGEAVRQIAKVVLTTSLGLHFKVRSPNDLGNSSQYRG